MPSRARAPQPNDRPGAPARRRGPYIPSRRSPRRRVARPRAARRGESGQNRPATLGAAVNLATGAHASVDARVDRTKPAGERAHDQPAQRLWRERRAPALMQDRPGSVAARDPVGDHLAGQTREREAVTGVGDRVIEISEAAGHPDRGEEVESESDRTAPEALDRGV